MKRRNASLLGNVLMGLGLVVMVVGVGYSILNQLRSLTCRSFSRTARFSASSSAPFSGLPARVLAAMNRFATDTGGCATTTNAAVVTSIATARSVRYLHLSPDGCNFVNVSALQPAILLTAG